MRIASKRIINCQSSLLFGSDSVIKSENLLFLPQDGRLHSGDHILRIGDTDLYGMGSEQVAQVLRQCGNRVKLVVTRGPGDENPSLSAVMPVVLPTVNEQVRTTNMAELCIQILTIWK